jgi:N-acetylmuramoyl-L-alanine amidase
MANKFQGGFEKRSLWRRVRASARIALAAWIGPVLALGLLSTAAHAASGNIFTVRFGGNATETRVVVELDRAVRGQLVSNAGQDKALILALPELISGGVMQGFGTGLVKSWEIDEAAGAVRLKLALSRPGTVKRQFLIPPGQGQSHYRYVLDIVPGEPAATPIAAPTPTSNPKSNASPKSVATPAPSPTPKLEPIRPNRGAITSPKPTPILKAATVRRAVSPAPQRGRKIVVIDAGHGGHDPGAKGSEHWEKDINLGAALALKARLERSGDYKVVLTRSSDVFIPLDQRVQIARSANADLFISLHSDSGVNVQTRGASIYTLSDKGSDRAARSMINKNDWLVDASLPTQDKAVKQILFDLTQRETKNRSANFAQILLDNIDENIPLLAKSHRDAGFAVLLAPDVPAVLLEMGFITNPEDERLLADEGSRRAFMNSVGDAIDAYFAQGIHLASR